MKYRFIAAAVVLMAAHLAFAGLIALGLDWRKNVFIQEVWRDDVPSYQIANLGKDPATISLFDRKTNNLLAGPWVVRPQATVTMDVRNLIGQDMVAIKLADGTSLGLLRGPTKAPAIKKALVSYDGLNGSGGRHENLWIEHPADTVPPGEDFSVALKTPANVGIIKWSQKSEVNNAITQLATLEAISESLPIVKKGDSIEIDTSKPIKNLPLHTVTLRFLAPAEPTMAMISGWRSNPAGGGHGITRGIIVAPAKSK